MRRPNKQASIIARRGGFAGRARRARPAAADSKPPATQDENTGTIFRSDTRLVVLHTTVSDKNGHLVTDLPQTAFTVYENGVTQPIKSFKREDVPVSMGLIIDNSGSMRDKRAKVEAAALALVKDSNKDDEVFVVNFNDEAFLDNPHGKDFTSDIKEMEEALTRIDSRGGTAMRDAIRMSIDHLKEKAHKDKKVLVVVTDGNDNSSVISLENLVKASQQSEVLIYGIGLLSEEERREAKRAERALNELAVATGGETFFPKDVSEVERIAHVVARDIRNQYTIQYTPTNQAMDGSFRRSRSRSTRPAGRPRGRAAATTRPKKAYSSSPRAHRSNRHAPHSVAAHPRLPAAAVAESVSALADRNVLGNPRRDDHVRQFWAFVWRQRRDWRGISVGRLWWTARALLTAFSKLRRTTIGAAPGYAPAPLCGILKSPFDSPATTWLVASPRRARTIERHNSRNMKNIFVGNLDFASTESSIRALFEPYGNVERVNLVTDRDTGRSRGFAFVEMSDAGEADRAINALNGQQLDGRSLNINEARPKPQGGGGRRVPRRRRWRRRQPRRRKRRRRSRQRREPRW